MSQFQTPVLYRRGIYDDRRGDIERRVGFPSRLGVLVGLEAAAARQFEIDLFLEQNSFFPEQAATGATEFGIEQSRHPVMIGNEIFDAVQQPR